MILWLPNWYATRLHAFETTEGLLPETRLCGKALCGAFVCRPDASRRVERRMGTGVPRCLNCERLKNRMNSNNMASSTIDFPWSRYRRKGLSEMRPYVEGEVLPPNVSISEADRKNGSPKVGDMVARNPKNHDDQWLVAERYFLENLEPM